MRAYGLFLLVVASALAAPQGEPNEANEVNEAGSEPKQLKARQLAFGQGEQIVFQSTPQFGAKLAPASAQYTQYTQGVPAGAQYSQYTQGVPAGAQVVYLQGGYQQPQYSYNPGQQIAYIAGAPAQQTFVSGAPSQAYYSGASGASGAYYSGSSGQFAQPQANLVTVKKTTIKPSSYKVVAQQPQVYKTSVSSYKTQPAPAPAVFTSYRPQPAPAAFAYKAPVPAPAPAVFKVSAPAPAPAPVVRVSSAPAQAAVQYSSSTYAEPPHVIVKQFEDNNFDGSFTYSFETDHGINVESSGFLKNAGTEDEVQVIQGSYTYYSPEGVPITTTYIADENGFQVQGDHLPVAPPLPEAIAKSIEYQRSLPPSPEEQQAAAARQ